THHSKDLYKGQDRGRIYRIVPEAGLPPPKNLHLSDASDEELVRQLENPNIWWRRTAQRLLVDRKSEGAAAALVRMVESSPSALGRVHALWTLDGIGKLDAGLIEKALEDRQAGVRENATILAERRLGEPAGGPAAARGSRPTNQLVEKLLKMESDPD